MPPPPPNSFLPLCALGCDVCLSVGDMVQRLLNHEQVYSDFSESLRQTCETFLRLVAFLDGNCVQVEMSDHG